MKASVIICTYSLDLLQDTIESVQSVLSQDYPDKEVLLVMDRNEKLYEALSNALPSSVQIVINEVPGLSEARNTGIKHAKGDIIVFIDDDAVAAPGHLSNLMRNYEHENVIGVGGKAIPRGKPSYPEELYWIGGFTYKGFPEIKCAVRNVIGCNMSFRKEIFETAGLFDVNYGRVGRRLVTAEETELSLRVLNKYPASKIMYDPSAIVFHKVHEFRQNLRYAMKRSFFEGRSKAQIEMCYPKQKSLGMENTYLTYLMRKSIPSKLQKIFLGANRKSAITELIWISSVITCVGAGYVSQKIWKH